MGFDSLVLKLKEVIVRLFKDGAWDSVFFLRVKFEVSIFEFLLIKDFNFFKFIYFYLINK